MNMPALIMMIGLLVGVGTVTFALCTAIDPTISHAMACAHAAAAVFAATPIAWLWASVLWMPDAKRGPSDER